MSNCHSESPGCSSNRRRDYLLIVSSSVIIIAYALAQFQPDTGFEYLDTFTASVKELAHRMWWGILLGIFFVGVLSKVPKSYVMKIIGKGGTKTGVLRATAGGLLLDLCSHGILLVGMKLYERGASLGQVMAFLIASPWNSLTLTFILISLIGLPLTLVFIVLSALIAIVSGFMFDALVRRGILPENTYSLTEEEQAEDYRFKDAFQAKHFRKDSLLYMVREGASESRMILRWILFGIVLASLIRAFVPMDTFETLFGATLAGLGATLIFATILEVCSEGATPIAADIINRAGAPGNGFAFLMTGVSTDYTEIMGLRERTGSWKIALFLPLVTVPQIVTLGWLLNQV